MSIKILSGYILSFVEGVYSKAKLRGQRRRRESASSISDAERRRGRGYTRVGYDSVNVNLFRQQIR